jgi:hypothetical protein
VVGVSTRAFDGDGDGDDRGHAWCDVVICVTATATPIEGGRLDGVTLSTNLHGLTLLLVLCTVLSYALNRKLRQRVAPGLSQQRAGTMPGGTLPVIDPLGSPASPPAPTTNPPRPAPSPVLIPDHSHIFLARHHDDDNGSSPVVTRGQGGAAWSL